MTAKVLALAGLAMAAAAPASANETFKDWWVACDNTRECAAFGFAGEAFEMSGYLKVARGAHAAEAAQAKLVMEGPPGPWALSVDGKALATVTAASEDGDGRAAAILSAPQTSAVLAAAANGKALQVSAAGEPIGAISLAGQLLTGPHGWASELGHVCVDPHGVRCGCGATGCLETVVGQRALLHRAGQPDMEAYLAALEAGDQTAATVLDEVIVALGIAVGGALNLIDVTAVKLGGHLGLLEPWLAARLADEIHDRVLWSDHSTIEITTVAEAPLRAAMGAGLSALARVTNDPASWIEPLIDR